jgi:acyl-CoA synthetase (AMP-forming)/AMP-acid ligase II
MHPGLHAANNPEKPAYIMAKSGEVVTYGQLDEASNRGAHLFRELGFGPKTPIAIFMENHPRFLEICWAAQRSGLVYTTISSRLTAPEVLYIVRDCGARALITSHAKGDVAAELAKTLADLELFQVGGAQEGFRSYEDAIAKHPATPIADETEGMDMLYSSGTTGRPKGVRTPFKERALGTPDAVHLLLDKMYGLKPESIYLSPAPLYHAAPLRYNMSLLRIGATSIVMESFDPSEALGLIEKYRATHGQFVPTMFVRMLKLPEEERHRHDVSSLECAIHAAAPCPIPIKEQMIEWWGPVIHEYYAGTEGNGFTAIDSKQWLEHRGSVGQPLNATLHILDENGEKLPPGEPGAIYFEGGGQFEYHNDPEKTAESRNKHGWSTLGDIGYVDAENFLYLTDRKAHMIISGGVNIYPQEAENVLINHPAVADVAVVGIPNEDFGEEVKAVVQPADPAAAGPELEQELLAYCREALAHYKCPRSVDFEAELPRHPTGKLYKRLLKDRYWGEKNSRIV